MTMRVLMLNHNVVWRSTFFRAFYFARELVCRGHEVTVVTISPREVVRSAASEIEGVQVIETPDFGVGIARTGWDPWDALYRCLRLGAGDFDVVHGFDCRPVVLGPSLWLRYGRGVPWISDWADWWGRGGAISHRTSFVGRVLVAPFETFLEERFRGWAGQLTVTSRALRDRAVVLGVRPDRVHYIPSGANVRTITVRRMSECRGSLGLPDDVPVACFAGFVQYDIELAVRAFAIARRRVPDARLLLVGPRNRDAGRLVEQLGLAAAVHEVGVVPFEEMARHLGAADLLLLPYSDNLMNRARGPIKLGDYLAAGRAVLTNPVGDLVEVFEHDHVGVMCGDAPEAYGEAMGELLADRARCADLGRRGREVAENRYSWEHLVPQLEAVYDRALAGY